MQINVKKYREFGLGRHFYVYSKSLEFYRKAGSNYTALKILYFHSSEQTVLQQKVTFPHCQIKADCFASTE